MMVSKFALSEKWRNWFTWLEGLFFRSDVFFLPRCKICKANAIKGFFQNLDIFFRLGDMRFSFVSVQKNHTVGWVVNNKVNWPCDKTVTTVTWYYLWGHGYDLCQLVWWTGVKCRRWSMVRSVIKCVTRNECQGWEAVRL